MNRDYFLRTERMGFSKWTDADLPLARRLWGDPDVTRLICAPGSFTEQEVADRLEREIDHDRRFSVQYWPVFELDGGGFMGCCGLRPYKSGERAYELGFHLRKQYWGMGYATEGAAAVIRYAFHVVKAETLYAGHHPENAGSEKVLKKLGFRYVGTEFYEPTGLEHPLYEMYPTHFTKGEM